MKTIWTDKILQLIHDRPGVRQVEISDAVDCDLDQVERSIEEQMRTGLIIRFETPGPNGRIQLAYKIDPEIDAELVEMVIPNAKPLAAPAPAAAPFPTRETVRAPEMPRNTAPSGQSKADMAVEFIENAAKSGMQVTDDQLRGILGLKPGHYPATWLTMPVKSGRVHKDGRFWKPGRAPTFSKEVLAKLPPDPQVEAKLDAAAAAAEQKRQEAAAAPIECPGVDIDVPVFRKKQAELASEVPAAVELPPPVVTPKPEALAARQAELAAREAVAEKAAKIEAELAKPAALDVLAQNLGMAPPTRKMCTMNCSETPKHPERQALCGDCLDLPVPQALLNELSQKGRAEVENQIKEDAKKETKPLPVFGSEPIGTRRVWAAPEDAPHPADQLADRQLSMAIWNDGQLQLARGGRVTETLTLAEVTTLCAYLSNTIEVRRAAKEREKAAK